MKFSMKRREQRSRRRTALVVVAAVLVVGAGASLGNAYVWAATTEALRFTSDEHDRDALDALEPAVRGYVDAVDAGDVEALVAAFHEEGSVGDTGRTIRGHDAIRDWAENEVIGGEITVLGNTPTKDGSTVLLRFDPEGILAGFRATYDFRVEDGLIRRASLAYA